MRVLFIGIHPDDIELGCGGTVAVCAGHGYEVTMADLSRGECASNGTPDERAAEAQAAAAILGCSVRMNLGLPDTGIMSEDPGQERDVVALLRKVRPHVLLVPNADDPHPDHSSGATLVQRAVYLAGIAGYPGGQAWRVPSVLVYSGRNEVRPDLIVDTSHTFARKRDAILAHATQFGAGDDRARTPLNHPDFLSAIEARDRVCGQRIGVRYGEALHAPAPIALDGFDVFRPGSDA
jgi:bacillithiol biosynthesis deacetylase BshB1